MNMDLKLLNDVFYQRNYERIDNIINKTRIAAFICLALAVDCLVLWLVFLLCNMLIGFIICISLNAAFACAVAVLIISISKLIQEKRFLTIEHNIEELKINHQNKLDVMFF